MRALPAGITPVVCLDANARYRLSSLHAEVPDNQNAVCLDHFCRRFSMFRTRAYTPAGAGIKTWTSPNGAPACLDYILCPEAWAEHADTLTDLGLLDAHSGIDHDVLGLQVRFEIEDCPKMPRVDTRAMLQPAGRAAITSLFQHVPVCPWDMPSDDHLRVTQQHLMQGVQAIFSQQRALPRRPVLSAATWELLGVKRWARRVFRRRAGLQARKVLHACLLAWRSVRTGQACAPVLDLARYDHQAAAYICFMRSLAGLIRDSTRRDEAECAGEHLQAARHRGVDAMATALRAVLKHGRRFKAPRPAINLRVHDELVTDEQDVLRAFGQSFAEAEQATCCDFATLLTPPPVAVPDRIVIRDTPTLVALAGAFSALKMGKAPGLTTLPAELFKAAPLEAALQYMPVLLKSQSTQLLPAIWRGVHAVPLLKPRKDPSNVKSFRSIALMDVPSKAVAHACRPSLASAFESITAVSTGGSRKHIPLERPSMAVQSHLAMLKTCKCNGGVLFLDGTSAFYAVDRSLLFATTRDEQQMRVSALGVEPDVARHFCYAAGLEGAYARAGVSPDLVAFLRASFQATWFSTNPCSEEAFHTTKGTLPGAPLADLNFQFAAQSALAALQIHLRELGIQATVSLRDGIEVSAHPATWLDDVAVLVRCQTASELTACMAKATALAVQYFRLLGIQTNFQPGKSECILVFHGKGSVEARRVALLGGDHAAPTVLVPMPQEPPLRVRCVAQYTHLGTIRTADASLLPELVFRARYTRELFLPVRARLLRNQNFSLAERQGFLASLVLARLMHNAGTWDLPCSEHFNAFARPYMSFLRGSIRPLYGVPCRRLSQEQVCALTNCLLPSEALACARVRLLASLSRYPDPFVCAALEAAATWLSQAWDDLRVVCSMLPGSSRFVRALRPLLEANTNGYTFGPWPLTLADTKAMLKAFRRQALLRREGLSQPALRKARVHAAAAQDAVVYLRLPSLSTGERPATCPTCRSSFLSDAALASHRAKVHGQRAPSAAAVGTACQVCMKQFWSTQRLRQHLRRSDKCARAFVGADLDPEMPQVEAGNVRLPPTLLVGPRPWWASLTPPLNGDTALPPVVPDFSRFAVNHNGSVDLASFLQHWTRQVEAFGQQAVDSVLDAVPRGDDAWRLARRLADSIACGGDEADLTEGGLSAGLLHGAIAYGPSRAVHLHAPLLFSV